MRTTGYSRGGILQVLTPQLVHLKGHSVQDAIVLRHTEASAIFQPFFCVWVCQLVWIVIHYPGNELFPDEPQ